MVLAGHFVAASDYEISAKVPAIPPTEAPTIVYPTDDTPVETGDVTIRGACPVATPPVVVAIYDGDQLIGSVKCADDGTYQIVASLSAGTHQLVAKVFSITGDAGSSSPIITVQVQSVSRQYNSQYANGAGVGTTPLSSLLRIVPRDIFVTLDGNHRVAWTGSIIGGEIPYKLTIDWGDGTVQTFDIYDESERTFTHTYQTPGMYALRMTAVDAKGNTTQLQSTAITFALLQTSIFDTQYNQPSPLVAFIQQHIVQIYIITLSGLVFLWYLEHGMRLTGSFLGLFGIRRSAHTHPGKRRR